MLDLSFPSELVGSLGGMSGHGPRVSKRKDHTK
jgi:hypothetical protein